MFILPSPSFSIPYNPTLSLSLSIISYFFLPIPIFSSFLFTTLSHVLSPFFLFYHSSSPGESQRKKKIFFPSNQTIRFLDSGKKKKNFASNIPPIISRNILAIISPPIFFHERKRNEVEQVSRSDGTKKILEGEEGGLGQK